MSTCTVPRNRLEAEANKWMTENPDAMALFEKLALTAASTGRKFGMKLLAERVRWEFTIERKSDSFKINNNVAYIGRELIRRYPRLANFINLRQVADYLPLEGRERSVWVGTSKDDVVLEDF